jgi:tRNA uridine 5-carboxymethylaminomethyl modification enzyme
LSDIGYEIGLLPQTAIDKIRVEREARRHLYKDFQKRRILFPSLDITLTVAEAARRPEIDFSLIYGMLPVDIDAEYPVVEKVLIEIKYEGYLIRQQQQLERFKSLESLVIPESLNYTAISGLKTEAREKLNRFKPATLGQASRISGVSPGDIAVLMVNLKHRL